LYYFVDNHKNTKYISTNKLIFSCLLTFREKFKQLLSFIHVNETTGQASPATYKIQEDEDGYFISYNLKRLSIGYDARLDMLKLSSLGDYMRN
jgi:hypothetical protein